MGLYDSVLVKCPQCQNEVEFQSKAGECQLNLYHIDSVPIAIASSLNNKMEECEECGCTITFRCNLPSVVSCEIGWNKKD